MDEIWVEAVQSYLKDGSQLTAKLLHCQSEIRNPQSEIKKIRPAGGSLTCLLFSNRKAYGLRCDAFLLADVLFIGR